MYGSPVSKDLNLPVQPPMTSSGLLRYRSAPSTLLGEVCEDFLQPGPRAGSPDPCADNVFSRFLADHQIRDKPPAPAPHAPAAAHFPDTAAMASQHQHHQQQQMMFHSQQQQQQQQQQMAAVESGLYRTVSSGMEAPTAAASSLIRQSSSPAGFLNHLNMDNGWSLLNPAFFWYSHSCHSCHALSLRRNYCRSVLGEFLFGTFLFPELSAPVLATPFCSIQGTGACCGPAAWASASETARPARPTPPPAAAAGVGSRASSASRRGRAP